LNAVSKRGLSPGDSGRRLALIVRCIITASGAVQDCCIIQDLPYMARAVIDQLQATRVRPLTYNGKPAPVDYTWTFRFLPPDQGHPAPATPSTP
jgi:hypothetical protein